MVYKYKSTKTTRIGIYIILVWQKSPATGNCCSGTENHLFRAVVGSNPTATKLSNMVSRNGAKSPFEMFYGKKSKFEKNLKLFGVQYADFQEEENKAER